MYNRYYTPTRLKGGVKDNEVWVVADVFPGISDGICSISKTEFTQRLRKGFGIQDRRKIKLTI